MKNYENLSENKFLKIQLYYNKGGENSIYNKNEQRGYYLSVTPLEIEKIDNLMIERYWLYSGIKKLIMPVNRQSEKSYLNACELAKNELENLKNAVLNKLNQ